MSTWRMFPDADDNFKWEVSGRILKSQPEPKPNGISVQPDSSAFRLPSMNDLLLEGYSKLREHGNEGFYNVITPMFKTGSGKTVSLKQSSIAKALSVLGTDSGCDIPVAGEEHLRENGFGCSNSVFQTGSGKTVNISSAGLARARSLLGLEEGNEHCNFEGLPNTKMLWTPGLEVKEGVKGNGVGSFTSVLRPSSICKSKNGINSNMTQSEVLNAVPKPPQIKFHTAGGRSLSVSSDALKYARNLLGDPGLGTCFNEADRDHLNLSSFKPGSSDGSSSNKEDVVFTSFFQHGTTISRSASKSFTSPLRSFPDPLRSRINSENINTSANLIKKFDAVDHNPFSELNDKISSTQKPMCSMHEHKALMDGSLRDGICSKFNPLGRPSGEPLVDITNRIDTACASIKQTCEKKRQLRSSISPFKRPRSSKFSTPLNNNISSPTGLPAFSSEQSGRKKNLFSRYPFQIPRMYVKEYFGNPPSAQCTLDHLEEQVRWMKSQSADEYMFHDESGLNCIGPESLFNMLAKSGASTQHISKLWVSNHYKWIVWKLACYERCYSAKSVTKFLTVFNVLEELKYRYEREVNNGHRSAIKRILEGDALPSSMMVLCISAIHRNCFPKNENHSVASNGADTSYTAKLELTDGWYSVDAFLDVLLSKHLAAGKLFVGQKLRICGAGLCGWVGPVSPLEASGSVCLQLNINGTYRAHWADRLGFCKGFGAPLAFRCIKSSGGLVPRTLAGVTRIYPVLYKERLTDGRSIVRSERMESKMAHLYQHRRSMLVEGIVSEILRGNRDSHLVNESNSEGAKLFEMLETAAEPEVVMAEMSPEQLNSFVSYQAKLEARRQSNMEKVIEKALEKAGLRERHVTPFVRVRVVGLTSKGYQGKGSCKEGIITMWNPSEEQQSELIEGKAYVIVGLIPMNSDSSTLYLQSKGSTTKWQPLSPKAIEHFKPFFCPRRSVLMSNLGEVPLSSEFDTAAVVVHVGEVYKDSQQKKQWVFVTDGSMPELQQKDLSKSLLAISFLSPYIDDDSFLPINYNLVGSTVGFCNLIKRPKDQMNQIWVAEATENSSYFLSFNSIHCSHLSSAAAAAESWAKHPSLILDKLKEKVLFIIGAHEN